jgi:hypothetical protein
MKKFRWDLLGIFAGIGGVIFGVIKVLKSGAPQSTQIAIAMIVVFGAMGFILYKTLWQSRFNTRRLQKIGLSAKGKIIEVIPTNVSVNNNPQIKLLLEIKNTSGVNYTTQSKVIVPRKSSVIFQPGKEVNIKIDPDNEKNVIVVF